MSSDQPDDPKKNRKKGMRVGTEEELTEQAKLGGTRLPGTVNVVGGERVVETTSDLTAKGPDGKSLLKRGSRIRIGKYVFFVAKEGEFTAETIKLDEKWCESDAQGLSIFRMDQLGTVSSLTTSAWRDFKTNREYQNYLKVSNKVQGKLSASILKMAARAGGEDLKSGRILTKYGKSMEYRASKNRNRLVTEWAAEKDDLSHNEREAADTETLDKMAEAKKSAASAAYMGGGDDWIEKKYDILKDDEGKTYYVDKKTGEKTDKKPKKKKKAGELDTEAVAKKAQAERMKKMMGRMDATAGGKGKKKKR